MYAQLAGTVKVWAQNGMVWEVYYTDGTNGEAVTSSVPQMVINKMMIDFEKEYPDGPPQVETLDKAAGDAIMAKEFEDEAKFDEAIAQEKNEAGPEMEGDGSEEIDPPADEPSGSDLADVLVGEDEAGKIVTADTPEEFLDATVDETLDDKAEEVKEDDEETAKE
jgi:hypothetical protein